MLNVSPADRRWDDMSLGPRENFEKSFEIFIIMAQGKAGIRVVPPVEDASKHMYVDNEAMKMTLTKTA